MIDDVNMVVPPITNDPGVIRLVERVSNHRDGPLDVSGLWGSSAPAVCAHLQAAVGRPLLYVTAHLDEADEAVDDLETFSGRNVALLPAWEALPGEGSGSGEIQDERLRLCSGLRGESRGIIVAPIQALLQPLPSPQTLQRNTLDLRTGERYSAETILNWLVERGFERLDRVESPGDFARRGDIVDIFTHIRDQPVRLEFLDDCLEAIRTFDVSTQRSSATLTDVALTAIADSASSDKNDLTDFFAYLPADTLVVLDRPADIQEMGNTFWKRLDRSHRLFTPKTVLQRIADFGCMHITRIGSAVGSPGDTFHFDVKSLARFEGKAVESVDELCKASADLRVVVVCANQGERDRLTELIVENLGRLPESIELTLGLVHHGFEWCSAKTIIVSHHEIFHRAAARRLRRTHATRPIESYLDLAPADIVVHVAHGIARFTGMKTMRKGDSQKNEEFLTLEFAENAVLHVPTSQIDLIQKYIGAGGAAPKLSKLGGTRWKSLKARVRDAVSDLADELLRVQVARSRHEGIRYPADTQWQKEFEDAFAYEDTEDQVIATRQIKEDLMRSRPTDRLICGDVGFGKTELAIRAAFKVVEYGKQVAVLVPTTVLAEQHFRTFSQRLADYPFMIGCLSRFRSPAEQKKLIQRARKGQIDILIGTHRLLSRDVGFADLGLVIIDEEQRFGVEHKERLKKLRTCVDQLSLSATPIPRTLHMALVGLRDISSLQSPPLDRRAIATHVQNFDRKTIRDAILREINRDGQVFFVHNLVHSIEAMADEIRQLVPEARIIVGHGQMKSERLEEVMNEFLTRKADVLVATTIIESGIDLPNVNTIFVNKADRFGLADLHQLRGRVGRSANRGYCYFLLPPDRPVKPAAAKRLKAIEEFSGLGAGFQIAMRDLEIRGAGNLLGAEQSGHIAAVGYEMYCQLLEDAVRKAQGETEPRPGPVHLELDLVAHLPKNYVPSERARIDIYRRVVSCTTPDDLDRLRRDLADVYGKYPPAVQRLLDQAEIRVLAAGWKIRSIILQRPDLVLVVDDLSRVKDLFTDVAGTVRMPDARTIHWRPPSSYLESSTLLTILRRLLIEKPAQTTAQRARV